MEESNPDTEIVTEDQATSILTQQQETFHHLQKQAQTLLRTMIALAAFLAVAASALDVRQTAQDIAAHNMTSSVMQGAEEFQAEPSYVMDFALGMMGAGLFLGMSGFLFLILSIITLSSVMSTSRMYPTTVEISYSVLPESWSVSHTGKKSLSAQDIRNSNINHSDWLNYNNAIVNKYQKRLSYGQKYLMACAVFTVISITYLSLPYYGEFEGAAYTGLYSVIFFSLIALSQLAGIFVFSDNPVSEVGRRFRDVFDTDYIESDIPLLLLAAFLATIGVLTSFIMSLFWIWRIGGLSIL